MKAGIGLGLLAAAAAAPSGRQQGWVQLPTEVRSAEQRFSARVALRQPKRAELEETLLRVSDPGHSDYGKFLTRAKVTELMGLGPDELRAVMGGLGCGSKSQCSVSVHNDYIVMETSLNHAEELFQVQLNPFTFPKTDLKGSIKTGTIYRSLAPPTIPHAIRQYVDLVVGVDNFPSMEPRTIRSTKVAKEPGDNVDPALLTKTYGISHKSTGHGSVSCAEFEGAEFRQSDVDAFAKFYNLPQQTINVVGPNNGGYYGECTLDVEYLVGAAPQVNATMWSIAWTTFDDDLLSWAQDVQSARNPPLVHSISWGSGESGTSGYNLALMQRISTEFQKMGAQGLSVLVASGDEGTGHTGTFGCGKFDATWPATSPWVTAVGGTYIDNGVEVGWGDSGGGFSNVWGRPSYQSAAVEAYLAQDGLPADEYWNKTGRGIPDVSALATNYQVISGGNTASVSGTSAATPVFAAIIALVNDARIASGKKSLGFLNPALYKLGSVGYDVVSGSNKASGCPAGFPAKKGWDAVTGLGTPKYADLANL